MIEFDELMVKQDSETNKSESGNQAPSPSSSLPHLQRFIQGDEKEEI
jgi:hypothetical protein